MGSNPQMNGPGEPYPEHAILKARIHQARLIGAFLDWLGTPGHPTPYGPRRLAIAFADEEGEFFSRLLEHGERPDQIIGRFLDIDPEKLEAEKRAMLAECRRAEDERGN